MLVLLTACGSSSGIGDILGGGTSNQSSYELRGTVDSVDLNNRSIYLTNVTGYNSMLSSGGSSNSTARVYFDQNTTVSYNGRSYRPEDLERGDQITVRADQSGNNLIAEAVTVTYDAGGTATTGGVYGNPGYGSTIRGTIQYVDTSRRTITVDRGYGSTTTIEYSSSSLPVYFNNQTYRVTDLERGDEVDVRVSDLGGGRLSAQDVTVLRSMSSGSGSTSSNYSTLQGTVQYVDTSRRTIQLSSTNWISGFNRGTSSSTITVQYDANSNVEVSGQLYPISGLERGDVIQVQLQNANTSLPFAQRIVLVRDINR